MVYGAIDLHTRYSQIRIVDADGGVVRHQKVLTTRERLVTAFGGGGRRAHSGGGEYGKRMGGAGVGRRGA